MSLSCAVTRAEAVAISDLSAAGSYDRATLDKTISAVLAAHGGSRGVAQALAEQYGDHPDIMLTRMRWAIVAVSVAYRRGRPRAARRIPRQRTDTDLASCS